MKKSINFFTLAVCLLLVSCQNKDNSSTVMSKVSCQNADWVKLGYSDALERNIENRFKIREQECSKFEINASLDDYMAGFERGKIELCKPQSALILGLNGDENIIKQCPLELVGSSEEFQRGYKIFKAKTALKVTREEIKKLKSYLVFLNKNKDKYPTFLKKTEEKIQDREFLEKEQRSFLLRLMLENEVTPDFYGKEFKFVEN